MNGERRRALPRCAPSPATIARHSLPLAPLDALIEARTADLYSDPPATLADLEGRMGETESVLFQMAAIILGSDGQETADAAGHAGIAYGLAQRLSRFASDRARARTILPADLYGRKWRVSGGDIFGAGVGWREAAAAAKLASLAREHLGLGRDVPESIAEEGASGVPAAGDRRPLASKRSKATRTSSSGRRPWATSGLCSA